MFEPHLFYSILHKAYPSPHPNTCEKEEHEGRKACKCPALPYLLFFIWKHQTTHLQLIPGKAMGKESEGNCLAPPCSQREAIRPAGKALLEGRAKITPVGCPLLLTLSFKAQACGSACDSLLAISGQEWQRQAEVHRERKLFSLVFLHSHLEPDPDPKSFIRINKKVNSSDYFLRLASEQQWKYQS